MSRAAPMRGRLPAGPAARAIGLAVCGALLLAAPLYAAEPGSADQPAAGSSAAETHGSRPAEVRIFDWVNRTVTADRDLAVLGAPSDGAETIGRVRQGVQVFVVGLVAGGNWLQLRMPDGATLGYVRGADFPAALGPPAAPQTAATPTPPATAAPTPPAAATTAAAPPPQAEAAAPPPAETPAPAPAETATPTEAAEPAEAVITGHPTVLDTATLEIGDRLVSLYGIVGLDGQAAAGLQQYIDGSGGSVTCHQQGETRHVCVLPDNTDVAMAALINGAAMLGPDAPDSYLAERNDAVRNQRGLWGTCTLPAFVPPAGLPPELMQVYMARLAVNPLFEVEQLGEGAWLIDGVPYAFIDGAFRGIGFDFGRGGWGFRDRDGRWHDAPDRLRADLDRRHPHGEGLRHEAGLRSEGREGERGRGGREGHEGGGRGGREAGLHGEGHLGGHGFMQPHGGSPFHGGGGGRGGRGGGGGGGRRNR
jgi:hypothetical protein